MMKHVILYDRGEYWEVIADYSGSPRHTMLSPIEWENEYQGDSYRGMRESQEGAYAAIAPKGCGLWMKDWSQAWKPEIPSLIATSNGEIDFDGARYVAADGKSLHTVVVELVDKDGALLVSRTDALRSMLSAPVPMSDYEPTLMDGKASLTVGPASYPCDLILRVADPSRRSTEAKIVLRFR